MKVEWEHLAHDDFIAEIGDYMLRVEQMDKGMWWWEVYYQDTGLAFWHKPNDGLHAGSEIGAKLKATNFYNKHSDTGDKK